MRTNIWLPAGLALLVSTWGCSSHSAQPEPEVGAGNWEVRMESPLDTVEVEVGPQGEEIASEASEPILETPVVTETAPPVAGSATAAAAATPEVPSPDAPKEGAGAFMPGWRVQLFASSSMVSADALAARARRSFGTSVYVVYEPPLYKVRLGDFLSKEDARHMANRAKAEDFEAWVVEDLVVRPSR